MTVDFVEIVPEDKWDFSPDPPGKSGRAPGLHRIGDGFAPFCKQLRHVVDQCGVVDAALVTKKSGLGSKAISLHGPTDSRLAASSAHRQATTIARHAGDRRY